MLAFSQRCDVTDFRSMTTDGEAAGHPFRGNQYKHLGTKQVDVESPEFKAWFGNSTTLDNFGKPRVMYHGTSKDADFTSFNATGLRGAWFTRKPEEASAYAEYNDSQKTVRDPDGKGFWARKDINTHKRVIPVYLKTENPYKMTDADSDAHKYAKSYVSFQREFFAKVRAKGHDSVVFRDGTTVVFDPSQIKSAISTRGKYSGKHIFDSMTSEDGEPAGHPFRGNQYTRVGGAAGKRPGEGEGEGESITEFGERHFIELTESGKADFDKLSQANQEAMLERSRELSYHATTASARADTPEYNNDPWAAHSDASDAHYRAMDAAAYVGNMELAQFHRDAVESHVDAANLVQSLHVGAKHAGVDPLRIIVTRDSYNFVLNGRRCRAAGSVDTSNHDASKMRITLYASANRYATHADLARILAHESAHITFENTMRNYHADYEGVIMRADLSMTAYSSLRKKSDQATYPAYHALQKTMSMKSRTLAEEDGVTAYSRDYWAGVKNGTNTRNQAMHETFAEIHAQKVHWDVRYNRDSNGVPFSFKAHGVGPTWERFYNDVMKLAAKVGYAKDASMTEDV